MPVEEIVETPQFSLATSNAVSLFNIFPIPYNKKQTDTGRRKAASSRSVNWFWDYGQLPHISPGHTGGVPYIGVFLEEPSPYLRKFRRKLWKTPNG